MVVIKGQALEQVETVINHQLVHLNLIQVEHRQMVLFKQELAEVELEEQQEMLHRLLGFHLLVELV